MKLAATTGGQTGTHHEATEDDLRWVIDQFADAARRVRQAGADAVEIHAAHGYLLSAFLSRADNHRTDRWGGSIEARARLTTEVIGAVKRAVGDDLAVLVRVSGREFGGPESFSIDEATAAGPLFAAAGCRCHPRHRLRPQLVRELHRRPAPGHDRRLPGPGRGHEGRRRRPGDRRRAHHPRGGRGDARCRRVRLRLHGPPAVGRPGSGGQAPHGTSITHPPLHQLLRVRGAELLRRLAPLRRQPRSGPRGRRRLDGGVDAAPRRGGRRRTGGDGDGSHRPGARSPGHAARSRRPPGRHPVVLAADHAGQRAPRGLAEPRGLPTGGRRRVGVARHPGIGPGPRPRRRGGGHRRHARPPRRARRLLGPRPDRRRPARPHRRGAHPRPARLDTGPHHRRPGRAAHHRRRPDPLAVEAVDACRGPGRRARRRAGGPRARNLPGRTGTIGHGARSGARPGPAHGRSPPLERRPPRRRRRGHARPGGDGHRDHGDRRDLRDRRRAAPGRR